jgi:hypothetical protein
MRLEHWHTIWVAMNSQQQWNIEKKYKNTLPMTEDMIEYHVTASYIFQDRMNKETHFKGKLSV